MTGRPHPLQDSAVEEAAAWHLRRRNGLTEAEEARFCTWLAAAPENRRAWEDATRLWALLGENASHPQMIGWRADAFARRAPRRWPARLMALAAALLALVIAGIVLTLGPWAQDGSHAAILQTALGERSSMTLPDGTAVTLNTASRLRVDYGPGYRRVQLLAGQALFEVAKDPARPFTVVAGDRAITALGTEFDVRLEPDHKVRVTLIEGRVKVARLKPPPTRPAAASPPPASTAELEPGEQLVAAPGGAASVRPADVAILTSWRQGRLIFTDTALSDAVAEVNRYTPTEIILADEKLAQLRISGTFRTGQPKGFVSAITDYFPVTAVEEQGRILLSARK